MKEVRWLQVNNGLHPLLSVLFSMLILTCGLMLKDVKLFFYFLLALSLLFALNGYGKAMGMVYLLAFPLGTGVALLAYYFGETTAGAFFILGRILLLALCSVLMITINPTKLARALYQVNCPRVIALGLLITVRFIPVLKKEMETIREAMMVRGVEFRWYRLHHVYRALILPLVIRLFHISDTLALSLETRAFSRESRVTVYQPVLITARDYLVGSFFLIILSGGVFLAW